MVVEGVLGVGKEWVGLVSREGWRRVGYWFLRRMRQGGGGYEPRQAGDVAHGRGGGAGASHRSPMSHARSARGIGAADRPPAAR
ncbi:hypothetical protein AT05_10685 [Schleiferia thermophila str. Yellowstone]|nr:hypothetical protein AT05_10685 [Schleiferia thermophila str. Yellowstone]